MQALSRSVTQNKPILYNFIIANINTLIEFNIDEAVDQCDFVFCFKSCGICDTNVEYISAQLN